jgi:hypothetical protein
MGGLADAIRRSGGYLQGLGSVSIRLDAVRQLLPGNATALTLGGRRLVEGLDGLIAQNLGIVLAGLVELDQLRGDGSVDTIVAIASPQSDADQFEGQAQDAPGLGLELLAI